MPASPAPFPLLSNVAAKKTSDFNPRYNCIAWAFKDMQRFWWPNQPGRTYWPISTVGLTVTEAFEKWFSVDGWVECVDGELEPGFEKIALYTLNGEPQHAARQLADGRWTSKLGENIDLSHDISELDGPAYGKPTRFFRRAASGV